MRLSLSTDSNRFLPVWKVSFGQATSSSVFKIHEQASQIIRKIPLSKPIDGLLQRVIKALPAFSYACYIVLAFLFPWCKRLQSEGFATLGLLLKIRFSESHLALSFEEKKRISSFLSDIKKNPSRMLFLCAFASQEEFSMLLFLQGLFNVLDAFAIQQKLDAMAKGEIDPLSIEEIGALEFAESRSIFCKKLQNLGIEEIASYSSFWSSMQYLGTHIVMKTLREKSHLLLEKEALGFVLGHEDEKRIRSNLQEDAIRFAPLLSKLNYLLLGNSYHVGFVFAKEGKIWISDIAPLYHRHTISPYLMRSIPPSLWLYRFSILPLLSSKVSLEDAKKLQEVFSSHIKNSAQTSHDVKWSFSKGVIAFFLGSNAPVFSKENNKKISSREICTGLTAKMVYNAWLQTREAMIEMGYALDDIAPCFPQDKNIATMLITDFLKQFQKTKVLERIEDPWIKACMEPSFLHAELDPAFPIQKTSNLA